MQVMRANRPVVYFAAFLDRWDSQSKQDKDNGDDYQKFGEGEGTDISL